MSIIITDLCKSFDDNEILKNVNITLEDSSIYCLMGASGIGKTTLLRILMGLERADSGCISGIDTKNISCMFQEDRLIPDLSAIDNVRIVLRRKNNRAEVRNNLLSILPDDSLDLPVSSLSGGMKRRVALAKALSYPGKLIILDEPFTGLDKDTKLNVINYILKMRNNRTLLIATHGTDDADLLGAKIIKLD
uniref:ABC transporter ATP-binding protein n=1 Tax=Lachnospira eligens TaxID=39485 RepID=UPI0040294374